MALQEVHTGFTFNFDGSRLAAIQRGVGRASTNLNTIAAKTQAFSQRMGGFFAQAKGVIGTYLGFRAVRLITSDYAQAADQVAKFSNGLGINAQKYQALTHAAQLNGISIAELNVALPNLAKRAGDAADGSKEAALAFSRAGVALKDEAGKLRDPIDLLTDLADGMGKVDKTGRRTQVLMSLFGRAGKKMGVLMAQGSEGIKKAMEEAKKLGIVLSDKQLKDAENFNDEMLRVKAVLTGVRNIIASRLLPALSNALEKFRTWWVEGNNAERALRALKLVAIFTGIVIARMIGGSVIKQISLFVKGIWAGVQALRAMGVAGAATALKVWAIVAAFAFIVLAIDDLIAFAQGRDSVIGRLLGDTSLAKELRNALLSLGRDVAKAWKEMKPALLDAWNALKPTLRELGELLRPLVGPAFKIAIVVLISSIKFLNFMVKNLVSSIRVLRAVFSAAGSVMSSIAEAVEIAWEDASDAIVDGLNDAKEVAKTVAGALGIDLGAAAKAVGKAWDIATGGIRKAIGVISSAAQKAIDLVAKLTGVDLNKPVIAAQRKGREKAMRELGLEEGAGGLQLRGLSQPSPALAFAGPGGPVTRAPGGIGASAGGLQQRIANVSVAAGAVQVTTSATGDPAQIAAAQNVAIIKGLNKVITDASRDLVKPPRGQR